MSSSPHNSWLHRFAILTALGSLGLIAVGGLVTSHEAGMAVPDWPNSYGYNMFLFPVSKWVGGIFYEHTHRLIATIVGVLVVALTRWLGGSRSRLPLALIGFVELLAGIILPQFSPDLKGAGYFLSGIGTVVLAAAAVWAKNESAPKPLLALGWVALAAVQVQGLLGGLRVVLLRDEIGIFHGVLAQLFFGLLCAIVLLTSRWWIGGRARCPQRAANTLTTLDSTVFDNVSGALGTARPTPGWLGSSGLLRFSLVITVLITLQLILGATMRHQHAGLAIPDFPLAYGKLWPATDSASIELYNQRRLEVVHVNAITAFQIGLQMAHRILALLILALIAVSAWRAARKFGVRSPFTKLSFVWFGLVLLQASLGAATIWSNKAADIATAHVVVGALLLVNGALLCLVSLRTVPAESVPALVPSQATGFSGQPIAAGAKV